MNHRGGLSRGMLIFLAALLVTTGAAAAVLAYSPEVRGRALGAWHSALEWAGLGGHAPDESAVYWCPMHPQIKRNNPNEVCPICNMALVPLGEGAGDTSGRLALTARQVQQAGVVTEPVRRLPLQREIDTTGRLDYDQRLCRTVTSWVKDKVRFDKVHVQFVGDHVEEGELVAEVYSPELISTQEDLLIHLERSPGGRFAESTRKRLRYLGMTAEQIEELVRKRKVWECIPIYAKTSGTVIKPPVREGEWVNEGEPLFHLADLSRLWLYADVYEEELPLIEEGQEVTLTLRGLPKEQFKGKVAFIDKMVQRDSRTVRVRIDIDNRRANGSAGKGQTPEWKLKPGMYARARFHARLPEVLAVPESAVLWSGRRRVVLVKEGAGVFRPREVRLGQKWLYPCEGPPRHDRKLDFGAREQRYHEVLAGLRPGEEVVTAGAFLLNAESQFQGILTKMLPPENKSATLAEVLGKKLAGRVREVLDAYYKLSRTLADDSLATVPERATALQEAAERLGREAEGEKSAPLTGAARRLARLAGEMAKPTPKDLRQARFGFGRVSRQLITLLADNGGKTLFGKDVFLFECGMSKVGYERWLWFSEVKLNPYMGQKMFG
jgi:Cu(I)/Ag(I) efflux system membrane fusion protein